MSGESTTVEAFFEGAENVYDGAADNFNSKRVVLREKSTAGKHFYTNKQIVTASSSNSGIFSNFQDEFNLNQTVSGVTMDSLGF